jgi:hypothetical protein
MKVKSLIMQITPGASPDQVGYKLYMEEAPAPVTYESQAWTLGPETEVDISTLEGMTTKNGVYNFGLVTDRRRRQRIIDADHRRRGRGLCRPGPSPRRSSS